MKTTKGKTKTVKPERVVRISRVNTRGWRQETSIMATVKATSLRNALTDYFNKTLRPSGFTDPILQGNTLTVNDNETPVVYVAEDCS